MPHHESLTSGEMTQKRDFHGVALPQVHSQSLSYGSRTFSTTSGSQSFGSKPKLGLGVNAQTGRLQWCPGFTCCKLLIIIPVIMLPITLVLILLMRMDGMLMALQMHQHHRHVHGRGGYQDQEPPLYLEDYEGGMDNDPYQDMISEQLLIPRDKKVRLSEEERIKRCISFRFGLSEALDWEDRDLMKDARTSFLPRDTTVIPRECLDNFNINSHINYNDFDLNALLESYGRRRIRRDNSEQDYEAPAVEEEKELEPLIPGPESISVLKSFWNDQTTKESMREVQARTMKLYMNTSVDPCDDFYQYVCGNWEKHHPIPKDKAGFDTFEMLRENLDIVLKELLESKDYDETTPKKVEHIVANTYEQLPNTQADIVKPVQSQHAEETEKEKLVQRLVEERHTLGQLLERYKRDSRIFTNTKRKRFTSHQNISESLFAYSSYRQKTGFTAPPSLVTFQPTSMPEHSSSHDAHMKARQLYQSCTNIKLLEERGVQPLLDLVQSLGGWPVLDPNWSPDNFDWLNLTAHLRRYNNDILIVQWVGPDIKNSDENIIQFDQTNLGLPTRDYYLQDVNAKYLNAYQRFMADVMNKLGADKEEATKTAADLISFETQLASITAPAEKRLNVTKLYKRMTLSDLHALIPQIDWLRYLTILQQRNVQDSEEVVIYATEYMQDLVNLLDRTDPHIIANYLLWRFVRHRINNVDDRFDDTKQTFYHTLFGREETPSRWKVCISQVNTNMGMALGSMFVRKYFDENSKKDTLKMTHELQQAFREILKTTDWLDPQTKLLAEQKVNAMSLKIGYPDFILNTVELNEKYAGIEIDPSKYFENTLNVLLHTTRTEQNKLHEPVNKTTWQTAPAIVNAYYSRNKNQIMFPAGILQPPFYHRHFPRSLNFGGIGVVIGHELTHGFDDKGRLFDRNGSIHKWWTDLSIKGFDERARCIISQYGNYTVNEVGIALNGESTQGENIADNGGIRQAFHAYKKWLHDNPKEAKDEYLPGIDMTGEQLFFLNFGQVWCGAMRPEAVRNKLNTAIHSPGRFRVIGTLSNSKDFAKEFNCPLGSPMNPLNKCSVW
ncbi:neprilysin-4 isoform X1 [Musca domestica]|uniref:Endothelin-converting enzyme 1 n=4 Tax=Musca domestica TaxID=7370 RepID=A0A1I8MK46_MUSDO|nr:neprilysin-4 isoform X1 [Musca domestica]XP_058979053.1 neprilysin-4 isoform X1 [Musca domestica]XP_058979055.1 neprilysin-4 isoform X1 [Musca domestica]